MGKEQRKDMGYGSKTYVLKVDMHCECSGCVKRITHGIKEISLSEGVERADLVSETGEVKVVGIMNPERFCCLLHEVTKKSVKIDSQSNLCEGRTATSQQTKDLFCQAPCEWVMGQHGATSTLKPVTPSAPPLPEEAWSETVPSERCWYRWAAAPSGTLGLWAASDVTVTLAMYEL